MNSLSYIHVGFILWLICIAACLGGLLLPKFVAAKKLRILFIGFVGVFLVFLFLPGISSLLRSNTHLAIRDVYKRTADVKLVLEIGVMTENFVEEGSYGGVFRRSYPEDIKRLIPQLTNYTSDSMVLLWTYQFIPSAISVDSRVVKILGRKEKNNDVFFFILPRGIIPSDFHIDLVEE